MRVLHTIDTTGPGGAETLIQDLAEASRADGFDTHVGLVGEGWLCDRFRDAGFSPLLLPGLNTAWSYRYLAALVRTIRRHRIDIVHSHLFGAGVYCAMAGLITRTPVVATIHGEVDLPAPSRLTSAKIRILNTGAQAHVFVSNVLRETLLRRYPFRPGRARVIHNGIPVPTTLPPPAGTLRDGLGLKPNTFLLGALGNVRPAKGYDLLMDVVAKLRREYGLDVAAIVAGEGDPAGLLGELLRRRSELGLHDSVFFTGYQSDKYAFLRAVDVVLMTSRSEGLPFAPLEAMVARTPVVSSRCGGVPEIIEDGVSGLLCPIGDVNTMATAVADLLRDPAKRNRLAGQGAMVVAERFSRRVMVDQYFSLYRSLATSGVPAEQHAN